MKILTGRSSFFCCLFDQQQCHEAQVVVERFKDKVTISGSAYYVHQVKKVKQLTSI